MITCFQMEEELVSFLHSRQSWFSEPNSDFFRKRLYERVPKEMVAFTKTVNFQDMKRIPECYTEREDCPTDLRLFFKDCSRLSILNEPTSSDLRQRKCVIKGVKPKKAYEISRFVEFLQPLCAKHGVTRIVDIGCGVGVQLQRIRLQACRSGV
uniref:Methyltranfer_dom domain-containing protein n=1 Tax=Steinernema glaseri TaxID=37863 RepID=A0A1I8AUW7_9BILA